MFSKTTRLTSMAVVTAFAAGCATTQPTGGGTSTQNVPAPGTPQAVANCPIPAERPVDNNKAVVGAVVGAVAGAVVGKAVSKKDKGAIVGAGLGGLFGYLVGSEIAVKEQADGSVLLDIPGAALFDTNQTAIKPQFADTLGRIAGTLQENPSTVVCIIGYTDSVGADSYNQTLSERRSQSVTAFLVNKGVSAGRLASRGLGERFPVASNESEAGRSQNRRVEMYVRN